MKRIHFIALLAFSAIVFGFTIYPPPNDTLLKIAEEYTFYQHVTDVNPVEKDTLDYQWTIQLCASVSQKPYKPVHHSFDSLFISNADPMLSPHGNKLYKLFVKDYSSYTKGLEMIQPEGQVLVKEVWNVREVAYDSLNRFQVQVQSRNDRKWYSPTTVSQLFIMYKEEPDESNDEGWIYGIVDVENKAAKPLILEKGSISSCIACHKDTKYDRIFGRK